MNGSSPTPRKRPRRKAATLEVPRLRPDRPAPGAVLEPDWLETFLALRREGKIDHIGISLGDFERLKSLTEAPLPANDTDFGDMRHDPTQPIWGVFGPDPRRFAPEQAKPLLDACVGWLVLKVQDLA